MKILLLAAALLTLSACSTVPDTLQVADEAALVSYSEVVAQGEAVAEKPARWGGIIAGVENKDGKSLVEVVHFPLNSYGKPYISNESSGRFKVMMEGFLDPVVFESGRTITFTGQVDEPIMGMIGEQTYTFPTLAANSYHLWRKETTYNVTSFVDYGVFPSRYSHWYYPFGYNHHRPGFINSRVRVVHSAPSSSPSSGSTHQPQTRPAGSTRSSSSATNSGRTTDKHQ